ncbi:MAG: hypothetical protein A3H27_10670 [Acidobacteria bacterium RIFCSPLOWO2_02_FULL_59_13]|nr:MAG: hypothetical protein A3H27_10670 [Acidobacteria bacterium RIFCSPLOWO2_02_FULL_59_13]
MKVKEGTLSAIVEGVEVMVKVTEMVWGVLVAPTAATWILPLYVPVARPAMFAETVTVPVPVPAIGETLSQSPPEAVLVIAVQFNVPLPELEIVTAWVAGLAPPGSAVNGRKLVLSAIMGGDEGEMMVNVTEMVWGVLVAPTAATWILPM